MNNNVIIIGGGGHARVIVDIIQLSQDRIVGILDDGLPVGTIVAGYPVLGKIVDADKFSEHVFVVAIGSNLVRHRIVERMNVQWYTAIHPSATISETAQIGEGSVIAPSVVVNAGATIGKHCIVNSGSVVEHGDKIGDFVHISSGVIIGGDVTIGDGTVIDIGSSIQRNIRIGSNRTIDTGSVVISDVL